MSGSQKLLFLGGLHRSGTSPLFQCLRQHPEVSGFFNTGVPEDEGQHLQSVYRPAKDYGGPGRFGFQKAARLSEDSVLATPENARRLYAQWSHHWDTRKPVLLEKSPPNLIRARFLQRLFPNAHFVMLVRHPLAVSYATQKWSGASLRSLLRHWMICHSLLIEDMRHLERIMIVKYEDFVSTPGPTLDSIYALVGLRPHPTTIDVRPGVNEKYFSQWARLRGHLPGRLYAGFLVRAYENGLKNFGYSLRHLHRVGPFQA